MKAGERCPFYSVSPFEAEKKNGDEEDGGVVELDSEGEDLRMETG